MPAEPHVSVVIPTCGRPGQLRECLESLACQTMTTAAFEVVVVDDGSPEPLDELVAEFASRLQVRLLRQANTGPAAARNHGARAARAPRVAFTDDDCRPRPEWLETLLAVERGQPGTLVGGGIVNGLPDDVFATTSQLVVDLVYEHFNADPDNAYFFASNNMLCDRTATAEVHVSIMKSGSPAGRARCGRIWASTARCHAGSGSGWGDRSARGAVCRSVGRCCSGSS